MPNFTTFRRKKSELSATPIVDGQFIFTTDSRELFVDVDNIRLQCVFPVPPVPEIEPLTIRLGDREYYYDGSQPVDMDLNATIEIILSDNIGITSVSGGGWYREGDTCEISCTVQSGYQFDGWYDENFEWISGLKTFSFTVNTSRTLTARAHFIPPDDGPTNEPTPSPTPEGTSAPTSTPTATPTPSPEPTEAPTEAPTEES
jgi:uncharacterized repeat protein (TIGR02543 family)